MRHTTTPVPAPAAAARVRRRRPPRPALVGLLLTALSGGALMGTGGPAAGAGAPHTAVPGPGQMRQAPAPSAPVDDPAAEAREPGSRGALGRHTVLVQPVYWGSEVPEPMDNEVVADEVQAANVYYRTATNQKISITLQQVRPWTQISLTEEEVATCDVLAIERAARVVAPDTPGSRNHFQIVIPRTAACDFKSLSWRGLSAAGDGVSFFNGPGYLHWASIIFGLGANAGLGMAHSLDCWVDAQHTAPVPLSAYCKQQVGGDPWDFMGNWPYRRLGNPSAANLRRLGALDATQFTEITPGAGQTVFLRPLSAYTGVRGIGITLGTDRYTLEYRIPAGLDDWVDDASWTDPRGVTRTDPGGGVIVRYQDLGSDNPADSAVIDFHPDGKVAATGRHPGLEAGESWTGSGDVLGVSVVSTTEAGASVRIEFPGLAKVERWSGADRYATSATISAKSFDPGVPVAYVASGEVFADALSGAPVAGKDKGPILLTAADALPGAVRGELGRLKPGRIVILGGSDSVSEEVASQLAELTTGGVSRWAGADRYSTSAAISANSFDPGPGTVYVASGQVFTDALSGAPVAGKSDSPVLLVATDRIPAAIADELRRLQPRRIVILGGTSTISPAVAGALTSFASSVRRISGADRYATSAEISRENYGPGTAVLYVASGRVFPDALSGAPVAGIDRGPILLVETSAVPRVITEEIRRLQPGRIVVLGGPATVSESVRAVLGSYLP